jgi:signal transduction histidine kinase
MTMRLRTQVIGLGVGTATLVVALAAIPLAVLLRDEAYSSALQQTTAAVQSTADYVSSGAYQPTLLTDYLARVNARGAGVTVQLSDDHRYGAPQPDDVLGAANHTKPPPMQADPDHDNGLRKVSPVQVSDAPGGKVVQVFCNTPQGDARVLALVANRSVDRRVEERWATVGGVALGLIVLAFVASEFVGRRLTRPLQRTAQTAVALSGGDFEARAPVEGPREVGAVAVELNALADRIHQLLTEERENAADLSHRLRTPLTALRLAAERIPDEESRAEVEGHVDQLQRTLSGVIRAARRGSRDGLHPRCDAVAVVRERADFWQPLADDQGRTFVHHVGDGELWVRANPDDLAAAVDALIENVIAHTPEGTSFGIALEKTADGAVLRVDDEGPGIPELAAVRGQSDRGSTGLGLDIAQSVAVSAGGELTILDGPGGHVRLTLLADTSRVQ